MTGRLLAATIGVALGLPGAAAPASPCARAAALADRDLDGAGAAMSRAQLALAAMLASSHGHLTAAQFRAAVRELEQLDQAAVAILPSGRERRALDRAASACLRDAATSS